MKSLKFYTKSLFSNSLFCLAILSFGISYSMNAQQFVNLLKNPGMNFDDSHWEYLKNQGIGAVVSPEVGINGTSAIHTGYVTNIEQTIDLVEIGYSKDILDASPIIRYSDWIKGSGPITTDSFSFHIVLQDENDEVIDSYSSEWMVTTEEWQQVTHNFINYGPGLRSITLHRQGIDGEYNQNANEGVIMDAAHISIANHLINPSGKTGDFSGWTIEENGGDGWTVDNEVQFRTSWDRCSKSQTVDLLELGYTEAQLDSEPIINVWEYYFGFDGPLDGSGYDDTHFLNVELRGESGNVLASFNSGDLICEEGAKWVGNTFTNYGPGLREVYVQHGGKDSEFWIGHHGNQVNGTQMTLNFPTATHINETEANNFKMSLTPNVVNQNNSLKLQLDNELRGNFNVLIQDFSGRLVSSHNFTKSTGLFNQEISTVGLSSGMYTVSVEQEGIISTKKLMVQ